MKYCQGTKCHEYRTKDRIRGTKGNKSYQTRRRSSFYYGNGNFCCQTCMYDWINKHIEHALNHFGRIHEPKRTDASGAWYKTYDWRGNGNDLHYFVNDLLGEKISITQQEYNNKELTQPS